MAAGSQVAGHPHSTASVLPRVGVASPGLLPRSLRVVRRPSVWRVIPISIMRQSWKRIRAAEVPIQRDLFLNELARRWHGTPDAVNHVPKPRGSKACLAKAHASCFAIIKSLVQGAYRGPTRLGTRVTEDVMFRWAGSGPRPSPRLRWERCCRSTRAMLGPCLSQFLIARPS
jgi:hypothetical protein